MLRLVSISVSFAVLALASPAAATDDCMCMPGMMPSHEVLESFEVGPFFSSDGTLLWSSIRIEPRKDGGPIEILVCYRPSDPRCSPSSPSPDRSPPILSGGDNGGPLPGAQRWPRLLPTNAQASWADGLGPARGVQLRVERPPRS